MRSFMKANYSTRQRMQAVDYGRNGCRIFRLKLLQVILHRRILEWTRTEFEQHTN